ncbi:WXG100 family type VII secretion target [Nocardia veterana]|uniref:WXG100 family type VII secretion target n=1 Tax=Nocardia veterana TaxID=132249 RepID=A0A7X6M4H3_9NOCA|nr:WXG100 family type VII secretion target [Nocardia veterana]NKY89185.1 WXG100 family type VII secretion target [Nocardia veterana]
MGFSAKPEEVTAFGGRMEQKHTAIGQLIDAAWKRAEALSPTDYQGHSSTAFKNAMEEFLRSARALNDQLNENAQKIKTVAAQFSDSELENYKRIHATDMVEVPQLKM